MACISFRLVYYTQIYHNADLSRAHRTVTFKVRRAVDIISALVTNYRRIGSTSLVAKYLLSVLGPLRRISWL